MRSKLVIMVVMSTLSFEIQAQQTQVVKVGPLGFLIGNFNLRYEKTINETSAFQVGANYYNFKVFGIKATGFGVDGAYRYYFKDAIRGFYASPAIGLSFNSTFVDESSDIKGNFSNLNLGATIGYQSIMASDFVIDFGLGYGYNVQIDKDDNLISNYSFSIPRFTFALGYAF